MSGYRFTVEFYAGTFGIGIAADTVVALMQTQGFRVVTTKIEHVDNLPEGSPYPDLTGILAES